jgi:ATP-dependent DNA helicase DinG
MEKRIVICDLETTGLDPNVDKIIEVGLVSLEMGEVKETFHSLVNPGRSLPLKIKRLTGLDDADLANAPEIAYLMPQVMDFIGDSPVAGHNVQFDLGFLASARGMPLKNHSYDTLELVRLVAPYAASYRLESLCKEFQIDLSSSHRALDDAMATARLLELMITLASQMEMGVLMQVTRLLLEAGSGWYGFFNDLVKKRLKSFPDKKISTRVYWSRGQEEEAKSSLPRKEHYSVRQKEYLDEIDIRSLFGPEGPFAKVLPTYEYRSQQEAMACYIAEAFNDERYLLMEAGTGVGKSMAYLVPAVLWSIKNNERVLVATHTINLQEQLWFKDIPVLAKVIGKPFRVALAKGRQNYICLRRWLTSLESQHMPEEAAFYARVLVWLTKTVTGDKSELNIISGEEDLWLGICGETEGCLGMRCPYQKDCFVQKARRTADEADLIITNHSLLFADVRAENRVLPAYGPLIIDEAHHLEESATTHLGMQFAQGAFNRWLGIAGKTLVRFAEKVPPGDWARWSETLKKAQETRLEAAESMRLFYKLLGESVTASVLQDNHEYGRISLRLPCRDPNYGEVLACGYRCIQVIRRMTDDMKQCVELMDTWAITEESWAGYARDLGQIIQSGEKMVDEFEFILEGCDEGFVYWVDMDLSERWGARYCTLMAAPVDVGAMLYERFFKNKSTVIMTSATITVNGSFDHFIERTGLSYIKRENLVTANFDSPFAYNHQALLFINRELPVQGAVADNVYLESLEHTIYKLIEVTGGRTLVLFTSHRILREVYQRLKPKLETMGVCLLGHGIDGSRSRILEEFKQDSRSVLFGALSFWEGVDVPGEALTCVVIVKLPFMSPSVPVIEARLEELARQNRDGFRLLSVPQAVIRFKQGFGRLIRSGSDRGFVVILDGRILDKSYGRQFLLSLPVKNHIRGGIDMITKKMSEWINSDASTNTW